MSARPFVAPRLPEEVPLGGADFDMTPELAEFAQGVRQTAMSEWGMPPRAALLESPMQWLFATLRHSYDNQLKTLLKRAPTAGENTRFSRALAVTCEELGWSVPTMRKYTTSLRRMLNLLPFPTGFVASLRVLPSKDNGAIRQRALGKYAKLPPEDPVRQLLEGWLAVLREKTRNQSELSQRNILGFYCNTCLPALGLELASWPCDVSRHVDAHLASHPDALHSIVAGSKVKAARLHFFLHDILAVDGVQAPQPPKAQQEDDDDLDRDDGDIHRISSDALERLHAESKKNLRDELWFTLMLTTGLRVGGLCKIQTRHVCDIKGGSFVVRESGKTREKGGKVASFVICDAVQALLRRWLTEERPADAGPYLFPGAQAGSCVSTDAVRASFQRLCQRSGLEGPEFHPHALRHTNAHLLLECGNSVEQVSKCLNHSSSAVTEKFYLRESATEVASRCTIPWIRQETESEKKKRAVDALPTFLQPSGRGAEQDRTGDAERKKRRKHRQEILREFNADCAR